MAGSPPPALPEERAVERPPGRVQDHEAVGSTPLIVSLDEVAALDARCTGGKGAALARVRAAGIASLPGVVLTTEVSRRVDAGASLENLGILDEVVAAIGPDGAPMVVRSSSVVEDQASTSHAGQFGSVLDVHGRQGLRDAVVLVMASRARAGAEDQPIAVLVQPMVQPEVAGVAFGVDPVTGRSDRRIITAVHGTPDDLVGGTVDGSRWELDRSGRAVVTDVRDGVELTAARLRRLAELSDLLGRELGCPQDVEWALVDDQLLVLQSRPVTSAILGVPLGPVFGPGPVAETFPEPLTALEADLWIPPLREGLREALRIAGAARRRQLAERDLVITVDGRVAIDLEISGELHRKGSLADRLALRVRRLRGAWRIGRLRAALPIIAADLTARADRDLESVGPLEELTTRQLVALTGRGRAALRSLHAHEILMGLVTDPSSSHFTGASVALRVLAELRAEGVEDEEILRRAPVVLSLVAPRVAQPIELPMASTAAELVYEPPEAAVAQVEREALRLRIRWMQEIVGQAAAEVGIRLAKRGQLTEAGLVRHLTLDDLGAVVTRRSPIDPAAVAHRAEAYAAGSRRLPALFRLSDLGLPISVHPSGSAGGGTGAGGGIGRGPVTHDLHDPPPGSVLVVGMLTPAIGPRLDRLVGVVSETGSVLSHLAILARESGVATVVGHPEAQAELIDGTIVTVDGHRGTVTIEEER